MIEGLLRSFVQSSFRSASARRNATLSGPSSFVIRQGVGWKLPTDRCGAVKPSQQVFRLCRLEHETYATERVLRRAIRRRANPVRRSQFQQSGYGSLSPVRADNGRAVLQRRRVRELDADFTSNAVRPRIVIDPTVSLGNSLFKSDVSAFRTKAIDKQILNCRLDLIVAGLDR